MEPGSVLFASEERFIIQASGCDIDFVEHYLSCSDQVLLEHVQGFSVQLA
jgi:hypothetical protein